MKDVFVLRPHHGMCLQFFEGKGYSSSFTKNMAYILDHLEREDPDICLVVGPDRICSACPHQKDGLCDAEEKTENYDRSVLEMTGLSSGEILPWSHFKQVVGSEILRPGLRRRICGNCQWDSVCTSACRSAFES